MGARMNYADQLDLPGLKSACTGEGMLCCSRKLVSHPKIFLSKSLEVQEVREMRRHEEDESEGFPCLRMGMMIDYFQADGKV